jgi:protein-S-isoprenylcysteine O-methyltransferase Ste14
VRYGTHGLPQQANDDTPARRLLLSTYHHLQTVHGYRIVRHRMYLGACAMKLFTPLALRSHFTLPAYVLLIPLIVLHLLNEDLH